LSRREAKTELTDSAAEPGNGGRPARLPAIASLLFLAVYFAASSYKGLISYFTQDDGGNLLNMHKYWEQSLGDVLASALRVITGAYRPLGGVYYFVLYRLAGFNPLPFRAVCLALMLANLFLAFWLLGRLSGSLGAALFGAVVMVHHPAVLELVYRSDTIYEILCFLFYFSAVGCYLVWRQAAQQAGRDTITWRQLAGLLALTACALDSKEMAITLPGTLLLVELIYFPPKSWSWRDVAGFLARQGRPALITAALVVPTIAVKVLTPNPLSDDPRYGAHSLGAAVEGMRAYQNFLLYGRLFDGRLSTAELAALWAGMGAAAIALRSRPMKFGLCFLAGSLLPVCLITPRNGYMLYIPLMGWALYTGSLLERLASGLAGRLPASRQGVAKAAILATAIILVMRLHAVRLAGYSLAERRAHTDMRQFMARLRAAHPRLPRGTSLLVTDDPLPSGYGVLFVARLAYGDPTLQVDRIKMLRETPAGDQLLRYDYVLSAARGLQDVRGVSDGRRPVEVWFLPAPAGQRDSYAAEIPEYAGQTIELASRTISGNLSDRRVVANCTVDASGRTALAVHPESLPTTIQAEWVRLRGGNWMAASGTLIINDLGGQ